MPRFFHLFWKKGGAKKLSDILGSSKGGVTLIFRQAEKVSLLR